MNKFKKIPAFLAIAAVALPGFAFAQDHDDHRGDRHDDRHVEQRHDDEHHDDHHRARDWHRGDHIPAEYRDNRYVVNDWRARHLKAPPRGYHYVQVDGDFVLAAIATGVIASVLINN